MASGDAFIGIVKQVFSGDTIVVRDRPVDGPPPERTITLSNISCGRLARRPTEANPSGTPEDPYAWLAREYIRSKLVGKEVFCVVELELPTGRKYGCVYLGKSVSGENIGLSLVQQGMAEVRKLNPAIAEKNPAFKQLLDAEEEAKSLGKGRWSQPSTWIPRELVWSINNPKEFLEMHKGHGLKAVVEHVRDGSTYQLTILPDQSINSSYYNITFSLSGIRCPTIKFENGTQVPEPFALDAQFFVESRLLQREVTVLLESMVYQNFIGTLLHPNGNIAEVLLREGLARCVDWNLSLVSAPGGAESYRSCERIAKEKHSRIWKDYGVENAVNIENRMTDQKTMIAGTIFTGTVSEIGTGDNLIVNCSDGLQRKFFLASIRGPKPQGNLKEGSEPPSSQRPRIRPLYDVPYMFEARETLRPFVGKMVHVLVDYVRPKTATLPDERLCATIKCSEIDLAVLLVSKGLASVIRYRNDNDSRSSNYTDLLAADEAAQTGMLGIYTKQEPPVHRVVDITGNVTKSRQFLPFLQRNARMDAIVEFVVHASRMRVYVSRETCLVTLLLAGIQCPRRGRAGAEGAQAIDMPFSAEGYAFTKERCLQRNVDIDIESMDRVGNFIGWVHLKSIGSESEQMQKVSGKKKKKAVEPVVERQNLSVLLVINGLATVLRSPATERSPYYNDLLEAEETAKSSRMGLWSDDDFVKEWQGDAGDEAEEDAADVEDSYRSNVTRAPTYVDDMSALNINGDAGDRLNTVKDPKPVWKAVQITAISKPPGTSEGFRFFAQHVSDSGALIQISRALNSQQLPTVPDFIPKNGYLCAACFSLDNCWYRAKVTKRTLKLIVVHFIDFGNEETIGMSDVPARVSPLPAGPLMSLPPQITEYRLAFIQLPPDAIDRTSAEHAFIEQVENKEVRLAVQFDSLRCAMESAKPVPGVVVEVPTADTTSLSPINALDVGFHLLSEGLVCVEPIQPKLLKSLPRGLLSRYLDAQASARKLRKNIWQYGDFRVDDSQQ